jgi:hypothetical protein
MCKPLFCTVNHGGLQLKKVVYTYMQCSRAGATKRLPPTINERSFFTQQLDVIHRRI